MLGSQTVFIVRRSQAGVDVYGLETYTTMEIKVSGVLVAPTASTDTVEVNRNPADDSFTLYLPIGVVIQPGDKFLIDGQSYDRDGRADSWISVAGAPAGVVVNVKRRIG